MSTENELATEKMTPSVSPGNYSPVTVTVKDTVGALFLGIFAILFWIGWMRSEKRYRELKSQIDAVDGNRPPDPR
jgi:hypothetical protein